MEDLKAIEKTFGINLGPLKLYHRENMKTL